MTYNNDFNIRFDTSLEDGKHVISISGTWGDHDQDRGFNMVFEQCSGRYASIKEVVLDLSGLTHIGSFGVKCLLRAWKASQLSSVNFYILYPKGEVAEIIKKIPNLRSICVEQPKEMSQKTKPKRKADKYDVHVGKRMRKRREERNITRLTLSGKIKVATQQIQKYEAGENRISAGMLYRIACALHVTVDYFYIGLEGDELLYFIPEQPPKKPGRKSKKKSTIKTLEDSNLAYAAGETP